jgi:DNA-binding MarR family transcriptional regulator
LRDTFAGVVRRDAPDLSARGFGILLICYLNPGPHTVRGLAAQLNINKPAITRTLDRLVELGLAKRNPDPRDGRSVIVGRTREGFAYLNELRGFMADGYRSWTPRTVRSNAETIQPRQEARYGDGGRDARRGL